MLGFLKQPALEQCGVKRSLRTALFFEALILLVITVITGAVATFFLARREMTVRSISSLETASQSKAALLETVVARQKQQISLLGKNRVATDSLKNIIGYQALIDIETTGAYHVRSALEKEIDAATMKELASAEHTIFMPIIDDGAWSSYVIATPVLAGGRRVGVLAAVFDASPLMSRLFSDSSMGKTAETLLITMEGNTSTVLRLADDGKNVISIEWNEVNGEGLGENGIHWTRDYAGIPVLLSSRLAPTLNWSVVSKIDAYEVVGPIWRLASNVAGVSLMLVVILSLSVFLLARRIVEPIEDLTRKLTALEARRWKFSRSIFTRNELEVVDRAAADLTKRLRKAHEHLEEMVQKRTEELRSELATNKTILTSMDEGVVVTDATGAITFMNAVARSITETREEEMLSQSAYDTLCLVRKDGSSVKESEHPISHALGLKQTFHPSVDPEFSIKLSTGELRPVQLASVPILKGKKCIGSVTTLRDTTEERRIDQMKSEFISLVSHQLRTPLSSMRWYIEMILDDMNDLSEEKREYVSEIGSANSRMVHLVNALLNVSRLELGKTQVSTDVVDIPALIESMKAAFKLELKQKKLRVRFETTAPKTVTLRTDKALVTLILENMMSNAIKYGKEGSEVLVRLDTDLKAGLLKISVKDTGIGIPETLKGEIGKKLFRGTNARLSDADGNGLGLYISHIAASSIGGKITFVSEEGQGTTFTLELPVSGK